MQGGFEDHWLDNFRNFLIVVDQLLFGILAKYQPLYQSHNYGSAFKISVESQSDLNVVKVSLKAYDRLNNINDNL